MTAPEGRAIRWFGILGLVGSATFAIVASGGGELLDLRNAGVPAHAETGVQPQPRQSQQHERVVWVLPTQELQQAVDAAAEGAILLLSAGTHRGPVTIDRRMVLRGEDGARLVGDGRGSVVTVRADGSRIEDLEIRGSGRNLSEDDAGVLILGGDVRLAKLRLLDNLHGIYVRGAGNVHVIGNRIIGLAALEEEPRVVGSASMDMSHDDGMHRSPPGTRSLMGNGVHLWSANGAVVERNHIRHTRDGIYVSHTDSAIFRGNRVHDTRYGIHYMYSDDNVVADNELYRNVAGPALMFSRNLEVSGNLLRDHSGGRAYGLLLQSVETSVIRGNEIRGNRSGLRLQNSSANRFEDNVVTGNIAGMSLNSSSRDNAFTRNRTGPNMRQIELTGPVPPTEWSVDGIGNRWYGALPLDLTGDGISEWPHHEVDLMADRREDFPAIRLLTGSAGVRAVEWALARAPVPGMPHITDPHPLTRDRQATRDRQPATRDLQPPRREVR